jgi:hypothetical protein
MTLPAFRFRLSAFPSSRQSKTENPESKMPLPFITDGYTCSARIEGCESHPAIALEYRPMLADDLRRWLDVDIGTVVLRRIERGREGEAGARQVLRDIDIVAEEFKLPRRDGSGAARSGLARLQLRALVLALDYLGFVPAAGASACHKRCSRQDADDAKRRRTPEPVRPHDVPPDPRPIPVCV